MILNETLWPAEKVQEGDWTPVQWFEPKLAQIAADIEALPGLSPAKTLCPVSYMGQQFRATFGYQVGQGKRPNAFCTINENVMQTIEAKPETEGKAKKGKQNHAKQALKSGNHLLITSRFSTTSSRLMAIYSTTPAIGSAWYSMGTKSDESAKAYTAFINSTFGVIQMLNRRTKSLDYAHYEVGHIETLMLPDPIKLNLAPLAQAFKTHKATPLQRLAKCQTDSVRKALDHAAAKVLGIPAARTDLWREWLAQEPTVKG